jgi:hypothetical protein
VLLSRGCSGRRTPVSEVRRDISWSFRVEAESLYS